MEENREIKVIVISDVVNSSAELFLDEKQAVANIEHDINLFTGLIAANRGTLIKNTGDGILATFSNTTNALTFAQQAVTAIANTSTSKLQHRFGLHIGEIYSRNGDIIGQGVHLAARLQTISPVNGVAFTQGTHANLDPAFRNLASSMGELELKGMPGKISCFALTQESLLGQGSGTTGTRSLPYLKRVLALLQQFKLNRWQQAIAALALAMAAVNDLDPGNPLHAGLLDRRLLVQKLWRQSTKQMGPVRTPLPVVLVDQTSSNEIRSELVRLFEAMPAENYPVVALDFVLDQITLTNKTSTIKLAELIKSQQRQSVFVGYFGSLTNSIGAGSRSRPATILLDAGVQPRDLTIATSTGRGIPKPAPLQLLTRLGPNSLAAALSNNGAMDLPADAVIDWSLAWDAMVRIKSPEELAAGSEPVTLIGHTSSGQEREADLFATPVAFYQREPVWGGQAHQMPGVMVQAVLGQSLSLRHWLTPVSCFVCTLIAVTGSSWLSNQRGSRRHHLICLITVISLGSIVSVQGAISTGLLIPLALPGLAAVGMTVAKKK